MSSRVVYFNGQFMAESAARVSIYDSALVMGDMAYEVTRTFHHQPFRVREHLQRLFHSLDVLRIDPGLDLDALHRVTLDTLARNLPTEDPDVDWNIIHNVSRGPAAGFFDAFSKDEHQPTVIVSCYPLLHKLASLADLYDTGLDVHVPDQQAIPSELIDASIKTRSRWYFQLANLQVTARQRGAWPVLVDPAGYLTESTSANLFLVHHGEVLTPPPHKVLHGVTRDLVLQLSTDLGIICRETDITPDDAQHADEFFLTSTSIGLLHVRSFDGMRIGDGRIGSVSQRLRRAIGEKVGLDFAGQARLYADRIAKSSTP